MAIFFWGGYIPRSGIAESKGRMGIVKPWMFNMTGLSELRLAGDWEGRGEDTWISVGLKDELGQ